MKVESSMIKSIFKIFKSNLIKVIVTLMTTFMIPICLSVSGYGEYKVFQLYVSYMGIMHLGFCDGIFLKYGGLTIENNKNTIENEHTTFYVYVIILTVIFVVASFLLNNVLLFAFSLCIIPSLLFNYYTYLYQSLGEFQRYTRILNINSILNIISYLILIFVFRISDYRFYIVVYIIIGYTINFYCLFDFHHLQNLRLGRFSIESLVKPIKLGILLMIGNFSYIFLQNIDKWFVKWKFSLDFFSYYSFACQLLTVFNMFIMPISIVLFNYFCNQKNKLKEIEVLRKIIYLLLMIVSLYFWLNYIISNFLIKYQSSLKILLILFIAQVFLTINNAFFVNLYKVYKEQNFYFVSLLFIIILSIILNYLFLILYDSVFSIALATLVSMIVWTLINFKHFAYLKYFKKELIAIVVSSLSLVVFDFFKQPLLGFSSYLLVFLVTSHILMKESQKYFLKLIIKATNKLYCK